MEPNSRLETMAGAEIPPLPHSSMPSPSAQLPPPAGETRPWLCFCCQFAQMGVFREIGNISCTFLFLSKMGKQKVRLCFMINKNECVTQSKQQIFQQLIISKPNVSLLEKHKLRIPLEPNIVLYTHPWYLPGLCRHMNLYYFPSQIVEWQNAKVAES